MGDPEDLDGKVVNVGGEGTGTTYSDVDWPDPWPLKGMTNRQWAEMLLSYIFASDVVLPYPEPKVQYLTRALDVACMYSQTPGQRIRLALCDLLDEAMDKMEELIPVARGVDLPTDELERYVQRVRIEVSNARKFKGG